MKREQRQWHGQSRDDRTHTVGAIFVKIAQAVAEIRESASAAASAAWGGSIMSRSPDLQSAILFVQPPF